MPAPRRVEKVRRAGSQAEAQVEGREKKAEGMDEERGAKAGRRD